MYYKRFKTACLLLGLLFIATTLSATAQQSQKTEDHPIPHPKDQTTSASVEVDGKTIDYQATAGTIALTDNKNDTTARIFYVSYTKKEVKDVSQRPVTFFYNGGPGSASVWLHMGSMGPKRVVSKDTARISGAPYELEDNQYSLLDVSDVVFVDAPGTGFSRLTNEGKPDDFFGVDEDAHAFEQFIKRYITKYGRWNSPKYLFGESYGTTRNAVLTNYLVTHDNIDLNGVIMLSQILNFENSVDGASRNPGNYTPYQLALPTYAATAWYHDALPNKPAKLEPFLQKVEAFAMGEYAQALSRGSELDETTFNQIAQQLHTYTGLPVDFLKKANLRVTGGEFEKHLQEETGTTTGRLDTRFEGPTMEPLSQRSHYDPMSANIGSAYISIFNDYVRKELHFGKNMVYRPAYRKDWNFDHGRNSIGMNVMPDLAEAMKYNPKMKVMLNAGYFDLATPYFEGVYEMRHLPIPKRLQKNISYKFYHSGHMVYLHPESLEKLHDNVAAFIQETDNVE